MCPNTRSAPSSRTPVALVCTLGGKPQIATFTLDALADQGHAATELHVIHLSTEDNRIERAVSALRRETAKRQRPTPIRFESHPIRPVRSVMPGTGHPVLGPPITAIDDPAAPDAIWMSVHGLVARLKGEGYSVHLCVTGGPRLIGMQSLSAASVMLGAGDECWHLYTPPEVRERAGEGALLHAPGAGIRLVRVPLLPLGQLAPVLRRLAYAKPADVIAAGERELAEERLARCQRVLRQLTGRERDTLRVFADGARTVAAAARILRVKVSTVNTYTGKIYAVCREVWEEDLTARLTHHDLRERFGGLREEDWR